MVSNPSDRIRPVPDRGTPGGNMSAISGRAQREIYNHLTATAGNDQTRAERCRHGSSFGTVSGPASTAARTASSRLRAALDELHQAEQSLSEISLSLLAGNTRFAPSGSDDERFLAAATARVFAARQRLDEIRFELVAPERHDLTANDPDDVEAAHRHRWRALVAEAAADQPARLTVSCLGLTAHR